MIVRHRLPDPYARIKRREYEAALSLFGRVVADLDRLADGPRREALLRGLLAGNMFDLGSPETIRMYERDQVDFQAFLRLVPPRPWFVDHVDAILDRWSQRPWRQALIFADNAGSDLVLGVVPVAREMVRGGTRVVLAANTAPALNDVTMEELNELLPRLAAMDAVVATAVDQGMLAAVDSGNDLPLLDLSQVSPACDAEAADSDLIILQGMGRAVESNWHAPMRCDVWRSAMLKDRTVAAWLGASLFDAVCRLDTGTGPPSPRPFTTF